MPLRPSSDLPADLDALKRALAEGRRHFAGLSGCDLRDTDPRGAMLDGTVLHDALLP